MGSLKSNPILKYLLIPVLIIAVVILFRGEARKTKRRLLRRRRSRSEATRRVSLG